MRRAPRLAALTALLATSCTHYKVVKDGELNPPALRRVEERTADVRGLPFKEPVLAEVYTKKKSGAFFDEELSPEDRERARREDLVAHRLGMLPDGVSLQDLFKKALTQNAAGVYQPGTPSAEPGQPPAARRPGRLFIVEDALPRPVRVAIGGFGYLTGTDWANELFLSHELMHALQDQHFDLARVLPRGLYGQNEDMAIARKSVVESEANLVSQAYLLGVDLDSLVQRNALIEYLAFGRFLDVITTRLMNPDLPPFYAKVLVEQYTQGLRFLQHVTNRGGWRAVNRAYAESLPGSTEQLIEPSKLFGPDVDPPRFLSLLGQGVEPASLAGYRHVDGNVLGALMLRIYLEDYVAGASSVAEGWGGDRYDVYEKVDDDGNARSLLVWRTLWDSEADAAEAQGAFAEVVKEKYPGRVVGRPFDVDEGRAGVAFTVAPKTEGPGAPGVRTYGPEVAVLLRAGSQLVLVEGAPPEGFEAMAEELLALTRHDETAAPAVPPPSPSALAAADIDFVREVPPPLRERVFLPHHRMAFRLGLGAAFDHASDPDAVRFGLVIDREFRWGFRQRLEWTPPYLFSVAVVDTGSFQSVVTAGFADITPSFEWPGIVVRGQPVLMLTQAVHLGRYFGLVAQLGTEARLSTHLAEPPEVSVLGGASLYTAFGDRLIASFGAAYRGELVLEHPSYLPRLAEPVLVVGAATARGRPIMPTLEIRIYDGLHVYEASQVFIDPRDLRLLGHRHIGGLLLYF